MKFALIVLLGLYVGLVCICISDVCTLFTSITTASAFMCHAEMCKNRSPATTACFIEKCTADIDNNKSGCRMQCTLLHGNPPLLLLLLLRNPLQHPRGSPFHAYLRRLGSGMEPDPDPRIPFFPLSSLSTKVTFPVRAASNSSCSFPILDTSL